MSGTASATELLLMCGMNVWKWWRHHRIMTVNEMQFSLMPEKETVNAVFMWRWLQKKYNANGQVLCLDLKKPFHRLPRKVLEWAMGKKGKPDILVISVMSLYEGAKTRARVDYEWSKMFEIKVGILKGCVLSPFLLAVVVN